ncbi:radical SAM/SPASM domain-containing protein [Clostridium perfringens]|uniref:radical SAM/SPASM domain-containing protein n=1 Tax=Clostridium perfringens TaxID=1502 RepID=UPI0018E47145|nr:radical SAM protein [Clostridium perfringens]MBI5978594.1 radical SAM protein [Clostridium perfringens]MBI5981518.1 radical SAM protein [Clostridium perfringens]MBI6042890.1 radical SAM protein [Clostridium perfringens]MBI6060838.1 radical SAM protein [Clostridium perfringens]MBI6077856.1 radical SAM protein [Clostridium perfringens]
MYNSVVIVMTDKCTASCKHCCFSCTPKNDNKISSNNINKLIDELILRDDIYNIFFTGGEPFLYYEDLKKYFKRINENGKSVGVFTNAFWCNTKQNTIKYLTELREVGLRILRTSIDFFHLEYINLENYRNLLEAANELDIIVHVNVSVTKETIGKTEEYLKLLGASKLNASFTFSPMLPVGACKNNIANDDYIYSKTINNKFCSYSGVLSISYDGTIKPCCSPVANEIPFNFGNIKECTISEGIENIKNDSIIKIITTEGFDKIIELLNKNRSKVKLESCIDVCDLCREIFSNNKNYELIKVLSEDFIKNEN